jgi:hypothetical protein
MPRSRKTDSNFQKPHFCPELAGTHFRKTKYNNPTGENYIYVE